jgi:hypothetical protein
MDFVNEMMNPIPQTRKDSLHLVTTPFGLAVCDLRDHHIKMFAKAIHLINVFGSYLKADTRGRTVTSHKGSNTGVKCNPIMSLEVRLVIADRDMLRDAKIEAPEAIDRQLTVVFKDRKGLAVSFTNVEFDLIFQKSRKHLQLWVKSFLILQDERNCRIGNGNGLVVLFSSEMHFKLMFRVLFLFFFINFKASYKIFKGAVADVFGSIQEVVKFIWNVAFIDEPLP